MQKTAATSLSDPALVQAIAAGDQGALRILNQRYGHALVAVADRILIDKADAEEIAADVLWQVWRQAVTFDPVRGSVGAWLMTLVRSRAIDRLRARNVRQKPLTGSGELTASDDASLPIQDAERRKFVMTALSKLGENERAVLELAYYSDLSQSAIAERTGLPLGTIKSRIRGALIKLKEELKGFGS
ncbi:MAG TPA: sigma-70 family RNA polymerase sigma factor [Candidatus Binataceae bacterium]|nr:sigma-70 family RNA polymerase sigma factor [Candidatus Binataceae bacterium]